jgi:hypothetical protein
LWKKQYPLVTRNAIQILSCVIVFKEQLQFQAAPSVCIEIFFLYFCLFGLQVFSTLF